MSKYEGKRKMRFSTFLKIYSNNELPPTTYKVECKSSYRGIEIGALKRMGIKETKRRYNLKETSLVTIRYEQEGYNRYLETLKEREERSKYYDEQEKKEEKAKKIFKLDFGYNRSIPNGITTNIYHYKIDTTNNIVCMQWENAIEHYSFVSQKEIDKHVAIIKEIRSRK